MKWKLRQLKHKKPNKAALKIGDANLHFQKVLNQVSPKTAIYKMTF